MPLAELRVYRLRQPESLFTQKGTVDFRKAGVDLNGTIRADGHDLSLYGEGYRAKEDLYYVQEELGGPAVSGSSIAMRMLLNNQPITCSFKQALDPPKAICFLKEEEIAVILLRQGWAELGEGVTEETYIEALDDARSAKAIYGPIARRSGDYQKIREQLGGVAGFLTEFPPKTQMNALEAIRAVAKRT